VTSRESAPGAGKVTDIRGLLLLDKPVGPTSHDVVDKVRRLFGLRKVGHTGTLDPLASGLLVLCLGGATRFASYLSGQDKVYHAVIRLGAVSSTDDAEGEITGRFEGDLDGQVGGREKLEEVLAGFLGVSRQMPPSYSSKKIEGVPAYALARKGKTPELKPATVRIDRISLLSFELPRLELEVACSAGTYLRSLARDLGERLGVGGLLDGLVRTRVGPFALTEATSLAALAALDGPDERTASLLPVERGLERLRPVALTAEGQQNIFFGRSLDLAGGQVSLEGEYALGPNDVRLHAPDGSFLGVGVLELIGRGAGVLRPRRLMVEAFPVD